MFSGVVVAAVTGGAALVGAPAASAGPLAVSAATALPGFTSAPAPTITGSLTPRQTVTANAGTWSPTPTKLTYTWYKFASNGYQIEVQSGPSSTYTLKDADNTYRLKVVVTAERAGYATTSRTSATTLHVLIPAQRSLVAANGGDWHDMYFRGSQAAGATTTVRLPRAATHAYVELSCATPAGAHATLYSEDELGQPNAIPGGSVSLERGTTGSAFWLGYAELGRLGGAEVTCAGAWSLVVRPAATAPPVYSAITATDDRAVIYTGPSVYRTFAAYGAGGSSTWYEELTVGRGPLDYSQVFLPLQDGRNAAYVKMPAGPAFMSVEGQETTGWRMY